MAILQASGIQFGDTSVLNSFYGIVPQGKKMVFYQAAAPTGWTKITSAPEALSLADTSIDNAAIRLVSGSGGLIASEMIFLPNLLQQLFQSLLMVLLLRLVLLTIPQFPSVRWLVILMVREVLPT